MKHTYIFEVADGVTEGDLGRLAAVLCRRTVSYKVSHSGRLYDRVQVFTDPGDMHHLAHRAGFSGEQLRIALPAARRRGDTAVARASERLDNLRRKEDKSDDTVLLDWLEKNQVLINVPNSTAEWPMAHIYYRDSEGNDIHHYDTSYRSVIRRAMLHKRVLHGIRYSTPMHMPGGTKRSKRSA